MQMLLNCLVTSWRIMREWTLENMTTLFCWNVRDFNISSHRRGFRYWLLNNTNLFGGIIETHVKQMKCDKLISQMLPGWLYEANYEFSELGKIWVVWHPSVKVVIIKKSLQMITCEVLLPEATSWILVSIVYAANTEDLRLNLWKEIDEVSIYNCNRMLPWIVLEDFNQTRHPNEHSTAVSQNVDRKTRAFRECLLEAGLDDLNYRGNLFTWWNKNPTKPVAKNSTASLLMSYGKKCFHRLTVSLVNLTSQIMLLVVWFYSLIPKRRNHHSSSTTSCSRMRTSYR